MPPLPDHFLLMIGTWLFTQIVRLKSLGRNFSAEWKLFACLSVTQLYNITHVSLMLCMYCMYMCAYGVCVSVHVL